MHDTKPPSSALKLGDIQDLTDFIKTSEESGGPRGSQIRWAMRYRETNGLMSSGAVVEYRPNPTSTKVQLKVVVPRFVEWLATNQEPVATGGVR